MTEALLAVHVGAGGDTGLWATYLEPGGDWVAETRFSNGAATWATPALITIDGVTWCVHRGSDNLNLWMCPFQPADFTWGEDRQFSSGAQSSQGPAVAEFNGTVYCVHKGGDDDNNLLVHLRPRDRRLEQRPALQRRQPDGQHAGDRGVERPADLRAHRRRQRRRPLLDHVRRLELER